MRVMIDTGVEWVNEIPEGWINVKFKYLFSESNAGEVIDRGYWNDGCELLYSCSKEPLLSNFSEFPQKKRTKIGDILLTRNATPYIFIPKPNSIYTNVVQRVKMKPTVHLPFIVYSLKSGSEFLNSFGDIIPSFNMEIWKNTFCPIPELTEQHRIATYLDQKVAYIDNIIEKTKESIEEYRKLKQSVITEAVTKGLDLNVKMKNSGIEWIDEIPEHYKIMKPFWVCEIIRGNCAFQKDDLKNEGDYIALQYGKTYKVNEVNESFQFYVDKSFFKSNQLVEYGNTVLVSTSETIEDLGHSCFYNRVDYGLLGGEQMCLKPNKSIIMDKFLYYATRYFKYEISRFATGLKVYRFNVDDLKRISVIIPPICEQKLIIDYLDEKIPLIENMISSKDSFINELEIYRKSLIYEVVTGKKEIN